MKNITLTAALILGAAATALTAQAAPPKAKITPAQAAAAAVKKIPGKVSKTTYEFEDKHWQYAVVLTDKNKQMWEVEVNSTTGKVTDTEKTSPAEEASEAAADAKAAATTKGEAGEKAEGKD